MPDVTVQDLIRQEAQKAGVPPALALAVAEQESGFNPTVIGPKLPSGEQAIGTFQILPSTAKTRGFDPNDPVQNIRGGVGYLRELLDQNNGDLDAVLRTYGGVKTDTSYVPGVVGRLKKFQMAPADTQQTAQTTTAAPDAPAVSPPPGASPSLTQRFLSAIQNPTVAIPGAGPVNAQSMTDALMEGAKGFGQAAVNRSTKMMDFVRQRVLGLPGERPEPFPEAPKTGAGKIGAALEPVAEFAVAQPLAGGAAIGGPLLEAGAQAATAHALTKSQGGSEGAAEFNAALGAAGPVISKAIEVGAPMLRERAVKQLSRTLATGLENKGPMVDYALKTGEAGTPEVAKAAAIVRKAASDTLDLPIQASWGKWQTTLAKNVAKKGQTLEEALNGPLGSQEVPKSLIVDALDQLEASTKHVAEIAPPPGKSPGDFNEVVFNKPLAAEIGALRNFLGQYGDYITVRNLTDIKRTWDDYVYTLSTAGKVGLTPEALVTTAMKKAMHTGANSIRQALEAEVPDIARLNEAVTDAIRLQDLTQKLYAANPAMKPGLKNALTAVGFGAGAALFRGAGPGMSGSILGAHLGGATARMVLNAMESPTWHTLSPSIKSRLAEALAAGRADDVRRLLQPVIAGSVSQESAAGAASK